MYKHHHDLLPSIFSDFYVQNKSVYDYHTRQENLLHVPLLRTAPLSKTVTGVSLYNHFKSLICLRVSYATYKYNLKIHIIDNDILNLVKASWYQLLYLTRSPWASYQIAVTHVPWCMPGLLTSDSFEVGGGENVPGIPGACATRNFTYLVRGPN